MKRWLALLLACLLAMVPAMAEALPVEWDLASVYESVDEWQADYDAAMALMDRYEDFRGTLNSAPAIYDYLRFAYFTELTALQEKLFTYAALGDSLDSTDPVFAELNARLNAMTVRENRLSAFAEPEIYALPLQEREALFSDPLFEGYAYALRKYTDPDRQPLGEEAADALSIASMGMGYPYDLYSVLAYVELPYPAITLPDGTEVELTDEAYIDIVSSPDYGDDLKAEATRLTLTRAKPFIHTLTKLLEEKQAQDYADALLNHYETTREAEMAAYDVDPAVYDMLVECARAYAPDYQRCLDIHARALGLAEQQSYDLGAHASSFDPGRVEYGDAVEDVAEALAILGDEYVAAFREIVTSGHVDVYPTDTKAAGAFEMMPGSDGLPWVLFNYSGYSEDVSAIAHEMGHAVYDALAARCQPRQYRSVSVFTHEVASLTNELLYYAYRMDRAASDDERLYYLENLLSLFCDNFFTQMWYSEFEDYAYGVVESGGALDPEDLGDRWMELLAAYHGDAVTAYPDARYAWAGLDHIYLSSYYTYQYASSVAYAASIARRIFAGEEGAADDYLAFLKLGGSDSPQALLAAAGIDPLSPDTYRSAMDYFNALVDEYARLVGIQAR